MRTRRSKLVRVPEESVGVIRLLAEQENRSMGEVLRRAVGSYLRWRAEASELHDRPDELDPEVDGALPLTVVRSFPARYTIPKETP